uniref:Uncharacterized protein n=1 Tax=Pararge aegeria TaxID=116150 RepID=S4PMI9_9NEOP
MTQRRAHIEICQILGFVLLLKALKLFLSRNWLNNQTNSAMMCKFAANLRPITGLAQLTRVMIGRFASYRRRDLDPLDSRYVVRNVSRNSYICLFWS